LESAVIGPVALDPVVTVDAFDPVALEPVVTFVDVFVPVALEPVVTFVDAFDPTALDPMGGVSSVISDGVFHTLGIQDTVGAGLGLPEE